MMANGLGNWGMEQAVSLLKDEKVSISVLGALILMAYIGFVWADGEHEGLVNKQDFDRKGEEISQEIVGVSKQVSELQNITNLHVEEYRIGAATQSIRDAKRDLVIAELSGATPAQLQHIKDEIARGEQYKRCLVDRRPNCTHLLD